MQSSRSDSRELQFGSQMSSRSLSHDWYELRSSSQLPFGAARESAPQKASQSPWMALQPRLCASLQSDSHERRSSPPSSSSASPSPLLTHACAATSSPMIDQEANF